MICEYCHEDYDGYYKPLDKNAHVCVFDNIAKHELYIDWYGHQMRTPINYCPMCRKKVR